MSGVDSEMQKPKKIEMKTDLLAARIIKLGYLAANLRLIVLIYTISLVAISVLIYTLKKAI